MSTILYTTMQSLSKLSHAFGPGKPTSQVHHSIIKRLDKSDAPCFQLSFYSMLTELTFHIK